jgi:hypothetical protein
MISSGFLTSEWVQLCEEGRRLTEGVSDYSPVFMLSCILLITSPPALTLAQVRPYLYPYILPELNLE